MAKKLAELTDGLYTLEDYIELCVSSREEKDEINIVMAELVSTMKLNSGSVPGVRIA